MSEELIKRSWSMDYGGGPAPLPQSGVREDCIDEEVLRSILTCVQYDMVEAVESDIRNRLFITRAADQVNTDTVSVPTVPTDAMRDAGNEIIKNRSQLFQAWNAMLRAAQEGKK